MQSDLVLLFGGACSERRVSVASAQHLVTVLAEPRCWYWAPDGRVYECAGATLTAHQRPFETDFDPKTKPRYASLTAALDDATPAETFVIALHGGAGEDGTVQAWMEERRLYFTGSGAQASERAFDKSLAKQCVKSRGVRTAEALVLAPKDAGVEGKLQELLARYHRLVIKPVADGSSAGLRFVDGAAGVRAVAAELAKADAAHLVEPFIEGTELTVGVIDDEGGARALPASEIRVERGRAFDYEGKYLGKGTREITPAEVSAEVHAAAGKLAVTAHQATGCRGYSRTDIIAGDEGLVFLEINNLPGLTRASFIPQQLAAAGIAMKDFLARQLALARSRYMA